jgi:hypothetical protein
VPGPAAGPTGRCATYSNVPIVVADGGRVHQATRRWTALAPIHQEGANIERIAYGPDEIAFLKRHGERWDDSERRGRVPKQVRLGTDGRDAANHESSGQWDSRAIHPRWRDRIEPSTEAGYVSLRCWARSIRLGPAPEPCTEAADAVLRRAAARFRSAKIPTSRGWPMFKVKLLTVEGQFKRDIENALDQADARREWLLGERELARHTGVDANNDDHGWARHVAARKASVLLARKGSIERAWENAISYMEHGTDRVIVQHLDAQQLTDAIDDVAQRLPKPIFDALTYLLNAREPDGRLAATENALAWLAQDWGLRTEIVRGFLAEQLRVFREPLRLWSAGRARGWTAVESPDPSAGPRAVYDLFGDAERAEPASGRPATYEPGTAFWAAMLSGQLAERLLANEPLAVAALGGQLRDEVRLPLETVAGAVHRAAYWEIGTVQAWFDDEGHEVQGARRPVVPSLAAVDALVAENRSLDAVCRGVAALAYGLPREAIQGLIRKASR